MCITKLGWFWRWSSIWNQANCLVCCASIISSTGDKILILICSLQFNGCFFSSIVSNSWVCCRGCVGGIGSAVPSFLQNLDVWCLLMLAIYCGMRFLIQHSVRGFRIKHTKRGFFAEYTVPIVVVVVVFFVVCGVVFDAVVNLFGGFGGGFGYF